MWDCLDLPTTVSFLAAAGKSALSDFPEVLPHLCKFP